MPSQTLTALFRGRELRRAALLALLLASAIVLAALPIPQIQAQAWYEEDRDGDGVKEIVVQTRFLLCVVDPNENGRVRDVLYDSNGDGYFDLSGEVDRYQTYGLFHGEQVGGLFGDDDQAYNNPIDLICQNNHPLLDTECGYEVQIMEEFGLTRIVVRLTYVVNETDWPYLNGLQVEKELKFWVDAPIIEGWWYLSNKGNDALLLSWMPVFVLQPSNGIWSGEARLFCPDGRITCREFEDGTYMLGFETPVAPPPGRPGWLVVDDYAEGYTTGIVFNATQLRCLYLRSDDPGAAVTAYVNFRPRLLAPGEEVAYWVCWFVTNQLRTETGHGLGSETWHQRWCRNVLDVGWWACALGGMEMHATDGAVVKGLVYANGSESAPKDWRDPIEIISGSPLPDVPEDVWFEPYFINLGPFTRNYRVRVAVVRCSDYRVLWSWEGEYWGVGVNQLVYIQPAEGAWFGFDFDAYGEGDYLVQVNVTDLGDGSLALWMEQVVRVGDEPCPWGARSAEDAQRPIYITFIWHAHQPDYMGRSDWPPPPGVQYVWWWEGQPKTKVDWVYHINLFPLLRYYQTDGRGFRACPTMTGCLIQQLLEGGWTEDLVYSYACVVNTPGNGEGLSLLDGLNHTVSPAPHCLSEDYPQFELLATAYYWTILPTVLWELADQPNATADVAKVVQMDIDYKYEVLGTQHKIRGLYPPELAWDDTVLDALAMVDTDPDTPGIQPLEYVIVEDIAKPEEFDAWSYTRVQPVCVERDGYAVTAFFRHLLLSRTLWGQEWENRDPVEFVQRIRRWTKNPGDLLLVVMTDWEQKWGENVYSELHEYLSRLAGLGYVKIVLPSEFYDLVLGGSPPSRKVQLLPTSWQGEFRFWLHSPGDRDQWQLIRQARALWWEAWNQRTNVANATIQEEIKNMLEEAYTLILKAEAGDYFWSEYQPTFELAVRRAYTLALQARLLEQRPQGTEWMEERIPVGGVGSRYDFVAANGTWAASKADFVATEIKPFPSYQADYRYGLLYTLPDHAIWVEVELTLRGPDRPARRFRIYANPVGSPLSEDHLIYVGWIPKNATVSIRVIVPPDLLQPTNNTLLVVVDEPTGYDASVTVVSVRVRYLSEKRELPPILWVVVGCLAVALAVAVFLWRKRRPPPTLIS